MQTPLETSIPERYTQAAELERRGNNEDAFLEYLTIPGAEHNAVALARTAPDKYLALLKSATNAPTPVIQLLEGDLLLEKRDQAGALACYRAVVTSIASDYMTEWEENRMPWNYYPVEPPEPEQRLLEPFTVGSGAHGDNWLIRRFIALDAMDDAEQEFARIWELYQHDAQPHIEMVRTYNPEIHEHVIFEPYLIEDPGYDNWSLRFALDYAYFLKHSGQEEKACAILSPLLLEMNLENKPRSTRTGTKLTVDEAKKHPPRARDRVARSYRYIIQSAGISQEEYIRLAFGEFKNAGKEIELEAALKDEIDQGNNRSRLVLARIRMYQQDLDGSLALELAYIRVAGFDHASATYRRGIAYESHQELEKATEKYEALLPTNPTGEPNLPGNDRPGVKKQMQVRIGFNDNVYERDRGNSTWDRQLNNDVIPRLQRIYIAQGKTDELLNLSLLRFDLFPASLADLKMVKETAARFAAAGNEAEFAAWAEHRAGEEQSLTAKANLYWTINKPRQTLSTLSKAESTSQLSAWKILFEKEHPELLADLLEFSLALDPADSATRLQALNLRPDPLGPDAIEELEKLLAHDAKTAFQHGKGMYIRTRFRDYNDLAYRLARLYEQEGRIDELRTFGERVARGGKPFQELSDFKDIEGDLNSILYLLLTYADAATLERLATAWSDLPDVPAMRQLARKQRGGFATESAAPIPWANLPDNVEALVSTENVLSLAADEDYVYSGHPWGFAVYDLEGNPVIRVALGTAALHIQTCGGKIWVGTPIGLWSIEPQTWEVAYLHMEQDLSRRSGDRSDKLYNNTVRALAADDDSLWISTNRDIRRLDTVKNKLRIFSRRELATENNHAGCDLFFAEEDYIWVEGNHHLRRYDRVAGLWSPVVYNDKPIQLIGAVDGQLICDVDLGRPLGHRPAVIDRNTLEITIISIAGTAPVNLLNHGEFSHYGNFSGTPVFGPRSPRYLYDRTLGKLVLMDTKTLENGIDRQFPLELLRETIRRTGTHAWSSTRAKDPLHAFRWTLLELSNGVYVQGGCHRDHADRGKAVDSGGLYFIPSNGTPRRVSSQPAANTIASEHVYSITPEAGGKRYWLCGDAGVSLLNHEREVLENIRIADGLPPGRFTRAVIGDDDIRFLSPSGNHAILDAESHIFRPGPPPDSAPDSHVQHPGPAPTENHDPLLGGTLVSCTTLNGKTYVCESHGLLIISGDAFPAITPPEIKIELRMDEAERLVAEAKALKVKGNISMPQLKKLLAHENPFVRAEALASAAFSGEVLPSPEFPALIKPHLSDAELRVRCTAAYALTKCGQNDAVIPLLEELLSDSNRYPRGLATIELSRRGQLSADKYLREILETDSHGNYPFGSFSTIGLQVGRDYLIEATAPIATPEVFALMLELYTPSLHNYDNDTRIYPQLGKALLRHPEAAEILLAAYDTQNYSHNKRDFAMHVFQYAGTSMLGTLHVALESDDRVVRSNAARACGAIGDSSSIKPLIAAWDLPSGLSRASIIWALGELHATDVVPLLESAYYITRVGERRRHGPGQLLFSPQPQRKVPKNLKPYAAEQDEARKNEEHITSSDILKALAKIDPAATQNFYRTLTADENDEARKEAAERLAVAPARIENIEILRPLLADQSRGVQQTAAASLLLLGDSHAESYFLKWLGSKKYYDRNGALNRLARIESRAALAFARPALETIAAGNPSGYYEAKTEVKKARELLERLDS